ncbi:hypothetical protein ACRQ5Q_33245 [Bradyrhizobium sp. PMVTL-01]|uniref:hypothetical protein n=1 Tax=Bradyrhizobium sp. PMVTL-01 TaxID=3434999 RepID=UPI003F723E50
MDVAFAFQRVARKEIVEVGLVLRLRPPRARAHALEARRNSRHAAEPSASLVIRRGEFIRPSNSAPSSTSRLKAVRPRTVHPRPCQPPDIIHSANSLPRRRFLRSPG